MRPAELLLGKSRQGLWCLRGHAEIVPLGLGPEAGVCYRGGLEKTKTGLEPDPAGLRASWRRTPVLRAPRKVSEAAPPGLVAETTSGTQPRWLQSQRLYLARKC